MKITKNMIWTLGLKNDIKKEHTDIDKDSKENKEVTNEK